VQFEFKTRLKVLFLTQTKNVELFVPHTMEAIYYFSSSLTLFGSG